MLRRTIHRIALLAIMAVAVLTTIAATANASAAPIALPVSAPVVSSATPTHVTPFWAWLQQIFGQQMSTPTATAPTTVTPSATTPTSAPSTTPPPAPTSGSDIATEQQCPGQNNLAATKTVLVCLVNYARQVHGLSSLVADAQLMSAADQKVDDMQRCGYGHTACGSPWDQRIRQSGYVGNCWGENIAEGYPTPGAVFQAWMNSPEHRQNILRPGYTDLGIGQTQGSAGLLWVQEFGGTRC